MKKKLIAIVIATSLLGEMGTATYATVYNNTTNYTYSDYGNSTNAIENKRNILRKKGLIRYLLEGNYDNIADGVRGFFQETYAKDTQGNNTTEGTPGNTVTDDNFNLDIGNSIKEDENNESTIDNTQNTPVVPPVTDGNEQSSQVVPQTPVQTPKQAPAEPKQVMPTQPSQNAGTPSTTPKQVQPQAPANQNANEKFMAQVEQMIFTKVNQERAKAGVATVSYSSTMEKYARIKSQDMGDRAYFRHDDPEGNLITVQMQRDGVSYSAWGENIAYIGGVSDANALANQFMTNWMNSPGHRANILSDKFTGIGLGVYKVGNKVYATQEFIR
jgi:uncharacterized protein YkwD